MTKDISLMLLHYCQSKLTNNVIDWCLLLKINRKQYHAMHCLYSLQLKHILLSTLRLVSLLWGNWQYFLLTSYPSNIHKKNNWEPSVRHTLALRNSYYLIVLHVYEYDKFMPLCCRGGASEYFFLPSGEW